MDADEAPGIELRLELGQRLLLGGSLPAGDEDADVVVRAST